MKHQKGISLIEIIIGLALLFVAWQYVVPALLRGRAGASASNAYTRLQEYCAAQDAWAAADAGRARGGVRGPNCERAQSGYACNFRNLYYGCETEPPTSVNNIKLIEKHFADAALADNGGEDGCPTCRVSSAGNPPAPSKDRASYGYFFSAPPGFKHNSYGSSFALLGVPATSNISKVVLYVDQSGQIVSAQTESFIAFDTPLNKALPGGKAPARNRKDWTPYTP